MVDNLGANWLVFRPTWSLTNFTLPNFELLPSQDMFVYDLAMYGDKAHDLGLNVGLYPIPQFPVYPDQWWYESPRDFSWWVVWFEQYSQFILHHAEFAERHDISAIILGGDWVTPSLPEGTLVDGSPSGVPADAESRWRTLIAQVRNSYQGELIWALSYPDCINYYPPFINEFDKILIHWSAALSSTENHSVAELYSEAARILDQDILLFTQNTGTQIILGIEYPSAYASAIGCIPTWRGTCLPIGELTTTNPAIAEVGVDLQEQVDLYNAMFLAVNERDWVAGLISMGFYPPVTLQDPSISVYSKPASGVLWYWFPRLLSNPTE